MTYDNQHIACTRDAHIQHDGDVLWQRYGCVDANTRITCGVDAMPQQHTTHNTRNARVWELLTTYPQHAHRVSTLLDLITHDTTSTSTCLTPPTQSPPHRFTWCG